MADADADAASGAASEDARPQESAAATAPPPAPAPRVVLGALQMAPVYGNVEASMRKADDLLAAWSSRRDLQAAHLDLLVLPEMAFTGYQFRTKAQVEALAEVAGEGATFAWCCGVASKYGCGVCVGFPRRDKDTGNLYNSVMLVSPKGELQAVYDKHFLYISDKSWATEGSGFQSVQCNWLAGGVKLGLGICMDINPWEFKAHWHAFEFANFHKAQRSRIVAFASAWCNRHPDDDDASPPNGPDTINYWFSRLAPLLGRKTVFVAADRVGKEPAAFFRKGADGDVTFCGSSCIIDFERPALVGALSTTEEGIIASEVDIPL